MPMSLQEKDGKAVLKLESGVGIAEGGQLKEFLIQLIRSEKAEIDMSDAADIDVSVLQLVIAAKKSAERDGKTLCISGVSAGCRDTIVLAGMASIFGIDGN